MPQTIDNKVNEGSKIETKRKANVLNCAEYMDKSREGHRITEGFELVQQAQPGSYRGSDSEYD